jgi:amino-acid N-acetyltransferase
MNSDVDIHLACADYLEREPANLGLEKLFLLTTRTAEWWVPNSFKSSTLFHHMLLILSCSGLPFDKVPCTRFVQRGFVKCELHELPEERQARINLSRGSKYYLKQLQLDLLQASMSEGNLVDNLANNLATI